MTSRLLSLHPFGWAKTCARSFNTPGCRSAIGAAVLATAALPFAATAGVVIDEDFSSGASSFTVIDGGTWSVSSGRYVISSPGSAGNGLLGNLSVHDASVTGDYTVSGIIHLVGDSQLWNDAALVFGYQDASNFYYVSLNESNDGYTHGVFKVVSGSPTELVDFSSVSVTSDTDYVIEVERSGNTITVNIDSSQVASFSDSTFTGGQFGFGSKNDSAQFDDLLVEEPGSGGSGGISEDFSSGASNFSVVAGGTWSVSSGRYNVSSPASNSGDGLLGNISVHNTAVTGDYTVSAIVNIVGTSAMWNDAALIFGYQDEDNFYYVSLNESNDGYTKGVLKIVNGSATEIADLGSLSFTTGLDYDVEVERSGSSIVVRINDSQVASITDSTFSGGQFGFGTKNDSAGFDDLVVVGSTSGGGQVAAPAFTPGGGTYESAQNVTITSGTSGATIRYTTDGSTPSTTHGTVYSSAVNISSTTTLKAIAYKSGMSNSSVSSAVYTINTSSGGGYYVDPATGSMSNPGTSSQPWSTLEAVFSSGKTFDDGDVIYLRNGYHGHPTITGNPSGMVTIQPQSGHSPTAKKVVFNNASNFTLSGLEISPEVVSSYEKGNFVTINSNCSDIVVQDCLIYSAASISGWTAQNWLDRAGNGVSCSAPDSQIIGNHVLNTRFGINMNKSAEGSVCSYNIVENFAADGIRGLGSYQVFEYNLIKNAYDVDGNHDDGFQSWTNGPGGVGSETIYGNVLRGNVIISYTDPNQPLKSTLQGIGCFDGFFEDWIVENNVVCVDQWHGISFYGAINCRFINNTVVENPIAAFSNAPWLGVFNHKTRGASTGNVVRNNLVRDLNVASGSSTVDHNIESTNYTSHFVNYSNFDFHLKSTSSAVDAGSSTLAPSVDFDGESRDSNPDIGADEL